MSDNIRAPGSGRACRREPGGREGALAHGKPAARALKLQVSEEGDGMTQESSSRRQRASHPPLCARHGSAEPGAPCARSWARFQHFKFAG